MRRTRTRTIDIVLSALIALLVCSALAPALARMQRSSAEAKCQSNLRRWAQAISAYSADNHQRYPTNRTMPSALSKSIMLSDESPLDPNGNPVRFQYGVNWVEALYPYVETAAGKTGQDWRSFRRCPNARDIVTEANASMTYSLNYNLVEQPRAVVRDPSRLMMFRELDKLVGSVLRPSIISPDPYTMPINVFLTTRDGGFYFASHRPTDPNRHGAGSYICFTDGHVKYFTNDYYPSNAGGSSVCSWDPIDLRWYNIVDGDPAHNKTIAITP